MSVISLARSHALRGNAYFVSVAGLLAYALLGIPTRSMGTRKYYIFIWLSIHGLLIVGAIPCGCPLIKPIEKGSTPLYSPYIVALGRFYQEFEADG
ncbi:MAG: hypothetical protein HFP78_02965 [Methylococcales symbiont of Hymedesmia sp. n. MRB-2018]|nr:MAG: hypothetical protein HFP78_02965 [Methylococcales symbiont of Hymedesmia sp. n. MRB-2018]